MTRETGSRLALAAGSIGVAVLAAEDLCRLTVGGLFVGSVPLVVALVSAVLLSIGLLTLRRGSREVQLSTVVLLLHLVVRVAGRGLVGASEGIVAWAVTALALAVPLLVIVLGVIAARTIRRASWRVLGIGLVVGGVLWLTGNWYPIPLLLHVVVEFVCIALIAVVLCRPVGARVAGRARHLWATAAVR